MEKTSEQTEQSLKEWQAFLDKLAAATKLGLTVKQLNTKLAKIEHDK